MEPLPWLFENGGLVWRGALAALSGAGVLAAALAPRAHARRQAKRARASFGEPLTSLTKLNNGARVTLTGTIEVEGEAARRFDDGAEAAAASVAYSPMDSAREPERWITGQNARAKTIWLVVGGDRVELTGPVEVTAGSREVRLGKRLSSMPAEARDRVAAAFTNSKPHFSDKLVLFRSLSAGDRARVSGVLRKEAAAGEAAGYRAAAVRWTLVPDGAETAPTAERGLKVAFEGNPIVKGPGAAKIALGAAIGAVSFAAVFGIGGFIASISAKEALSGFANELAWAREVAFEVGDQIDPASRPKLPLTTGRAATALSLASPFHQGYAIDRYVEAFDRRRDADPSLVQMRAAIHQKGGDCAGAAEILASHDKLEEAAALAARCDPAVQAKALFALGDFAGASGALERAGEAISDPAVARLAVRAHLLAGKTALAAKEARRFADLLDASVGGAAAPPAEGSAPPAEDVEEMRSPRARARLARVIADALDARGGDAGARIRLAGDPDSARPLERSMLIADLEPPAERRARLEKVLAEVTPRATDAPFSWARLLLAEASDDGAPEPSYAYLRRPMLLLVNPLEALTPSLPAVQAAVVASLSKQTDPNEKASLARARYATAAAGFEIIADQPAKAQEHLRAAGIDIERLAEIDREKLREAGFEVSLGMTDDSPDLAQEKHRQGALAVALAIRAGKIDEAQRRARPLDGRLAYFDEMQALLRFCGQGDTGGFKARLQGWGLIQEGEWVRWALMARGDGAAVTAWLSRSDIDMGSFLPLGAPLLRDNRAPLLAWLRHGYRPTKWFAGLGELLVDAVTIKRTAEALGDAELMSRAEERASRFR
jgi:hypothetical protein